MTPRQLASIWIVCAVLLPACSQERRLDAAKLGALEARVDVLATQLRDLQSDVELQKATADPSQTAVFDPADKGYGRLDTRQGFFLVSIQDPKPYLDGHKLTPPDREPTVRHLLRVHDQGQVGAEVQGRVR